MCSRSSLWEMLYRNLGIRIATHSDFADFVQNLGLEFFSIGGDPAELMSYMVIYPDLVPQMKSLRDGEVQKKQTVMASMIENRRWDTLTDILSATTKTGSDMPKSTGKMLQTLIREFVKSRPTKPSDDVGPTDSARYGASVLPCILSLRQQDSDRGKSPLVTAGNIAGTTLKGFGKLTGIYFKGVVVDILHAAAKGFRQVPRLYGDKPKDYSEVRG